MIDTDEQRNWGLRYQLPIVKDLRPVPAFSLGYVRQIGLGSEVLREFFGVDEVFPQREYFHNRFSRNDQYKREGPPQSGFIFTVDCHQRAKEQ